MKKTHIKAHQRVNHKLGIGDVAKQLNIKPFVIRFWEREFGLKSRRSANGQRFYTPKDVEKIAAIKHLLHDNGFTIAGAKKHLQERITQSHEKIAINAATRDPQKATLYQEAASPASSCTAQVPAHEQLIAYRSQLVHLKNLLNSVQAASKSALYKQTQQ